MSTHVVQSVSSINEGSQAADTVTSIVPLWRRARTMIPQTGSGSEIGRISETDKAQRCGAACQARTPYVSLPLRCQL